jgi:hypothetical protein
MLRIKNVGFAELKDFFCLINSEPKLAYIDIETEMAFTEFRKPSPSKRLKTANFDIQNLPKQFFDEKTGQLMDDPVEIIDDKPLSVDDLLPGGRIKGRDVCDRKTFEKLKRNRRFWSPKRAGEASEDAAAKARPNSRLKYELLKIVRNAENGRKKS